MLAICMAERLTAVEEQAHLGAKPHSITTANRSTPLDRRIHANLALILLDRRAQNLAILREVSLG